MAITPETSIQFLKGVGDKRAAFYAKLGIATAGDLLYHFPRDYIDLSNPHEIMSAPTLETVAVKASLTFKSREQRIRKGLSIFKLSACDDSGDMEITVFNSKFMVDALAVGQEYIFYGRIGGSLLKKEMASPVIYPANQPHTILPVYSQTAGIHSGLIRRNISQIFDEMQPLPDSLTEDIRQEYDLGEINASLKNIHFPETLAAARVARERFVFEELLVLSCALSTMHADNCKKSVTPMKPRDIDEFYASLPFSPTKAQLRCIEEATADLCSGTPMNRLIQGDVGSGKTLVAAACIYFAHKNGMQSALMVPTEILAEQHRATLSDILTPLGVRGSLLTGSTGAKEKREVLRSLTNGETGLCIGTHALLSDGVDFDNLGLVVTDEQHRFGVSQRAKLSQKSDGAHVLVMSATPIPRTLSLIIYGDLQLSVLDELPPGRQPVETLVIHSSKRERALGFIRKNIDEGKQAYIVCPLIETGEVDTGLRPATEYAQSLSQKDLKAYSLGLLHGRMKPREKEETMRRFKNGEIQVLVSTTVVEVGVDVPNATIIMIENAERFGLSQLHQLRGRVGRGSEKSWCILVSDSRGENSRERLNAMKETSDGFKLAQHDLEMRGPGDFFGYRQHGLPELRVASLADNVQTMQKAQECAARMLKDDPALENDEHALLKASMLRMLAAVGERPN